MSDGRIAGKGNEHRETTGSRRRVVDASLERIGSDAHRPRGELKNSSSEVLRAADRLVMNFC